GGQRRSHLRRSDDVADALSVEECGELLGRRPPAGGVDRFLGALGELRGEEPVAGIDAVVGVRGNVVAEVGRREDVAGRELRERIQRLEARLPDAMRLELVDALRGERERRLEEQQEQGGRPGETEGAYPQAVERPPE